MHEHQENYLRRNFCLTVGIFTEIGYKSNAAIDQTNNEHQSVVLFEKFQLHNDFLQSIQNIEKADCTNPWEN